MDLLLKLKVQMLLILIKMERIIKIKNRKSPNHKVINVDEDINVKYYIVNVN